MGVPFPNVFEYLDYRKFLRDLYLHYKKSRKGYTFRYFADEAGFSSASFLMMVMDGQRDISHKTVRQVAHGFGLLGRQRRYFEALVEFNQALNVEERARCAEELAKIRPKEDIPVLADPQHTYLTQFYTVIIREMAALPDFEEDIDWIIRRLNFKLTPAKVEKALKTLIDLNLLRRNEAGKLVQNDVTLKTEWETTAAESYNYHAGMIEQAKQSLWIVDPKERDINAVTIPIQKDLLPEIKQRVNIFLEDLMRLVNEKSKAFDEVYQMNFQFFPLTKKRGKKKKREVEP